MVPFNCPYTPLHTGSHLPAQCATARGAEVQQPRLRVLGAVQADLRQGLPGDARTAPGAARLLQLLPEVRARVRVTTTTNHSLTATLSNKIRN